MKKDDDNKDLYISAVSKYLDEPIYIIPTEDPKINLILFKINEL